MFRLVAPLLLIFVPAFGQAEVELSFYGGVQEAPHSNVTVDRPGTASDRDFTAGWEGNSFDAPPHYGLRATWWRGDDLGFELPVRLDDYGVRGDEGLVLVE